MSEKTIIDGEHFLDMPLSTQALYFHLCARAVGGYVENAESVRIKINASEDDMQLLLDKKFILKYGLGIVVIRDSKLHYLISGMDCEIQEKDANRLDENSLLTSFETIYSSYPKKIGKTKAFTKYKAWVTTGRRVNGKNRKLTNSQIWDAIDKYKKRMANEERDIKYYKGFDTFMGDQILDYVDMEDVE